jgi:predicted Zn-dependent peptidase
MVLSAAGRVDHDALVAQAGELLSDLPAAGDDGREAARYGGGDFREMRDLEQVHLLAGFGGVSYDDPDFYTTQVFSTLLGGGMSSRLFQEVREKRGLCYSVYSFSASYVDGGLFGVYAGTGEGDVAELVPAMCGEIERMAGPIGEDEVARARAQLKAGLLMSLESPSSRCEQFARQLLIFGRPLPTPEIVARVDAVDAPALNRFAERLLGETRPTLTALGPIRHLESYDGFAARFTSPAQQM